MSKTLDQKRQAILQQMQTIKRLRRGSFSEQLLYRKKGSEITTYGPYFVLQGFRQGQKFSERISAEAAAQVAHDVQNYQRFQHLAEQLVEVTDQLTREQIPERGAKVDSVKKDR